MKLLFVDVPFLGVQHVKPEVILLLQCQSFPIPSRLLNIELKIELSNITCQFMYQCLGRKIPMGSLMKKGSSSGVFSTFLKKVV